MYYILVPTAEGRNAAIETLRARGVQSTFHYVPLHSAPAGIRFGRPDGELSLTDDLSARLIRLPLSAGLTQTQQTAVLDALSDGTI